MAIVWAVVGLAVFGMSGWATFGAFAVRQMRVRVDAVEAIASLRFDLAEVSRVRDDSLNELERRESEADGLRKQIGILEGTIQEQGEILAAAAVPGTAAGRWDRGLSERVPAPQDDPADR